MLNQLMMNWSKGGAMKSARIHVVALLLLVVAVAVAAIWLSRGRRGSHGARMRKLVLFCWEPLFSYYFKQPETRVHHLMDRYDTLVVRRTDDPETYVTGTGDDILNIADVHDFVNGPGGARIAVDMFTDGSIQILSGVAGIKRVLFVEDLHPGEEDLRKAAKCNVFKASGCFTQDLLDNLNRYDAVLGPYLYLLQPFLHLLRVPLYTTYHFFDATSVVSRDTSKREHRLLICGTISEAYPFRKLLHTNCSPFLAKTEGQGRSPAEWYSLLSEYRFVFADAPLNKTFPGRKYLVAKFFEIIGSKSLLVTDDALVDELDRLGLQEDVHYIAMNEANIDAKLLCLANMSIAEIEEMTTRAYFIIYPTHERASSLRQMTLAIEETM